jgi:hypothetical protein
MISGKVRDFRRCERAEITFAPFALVGGLNEHGKSSIAQAFGAALCKEPLPPGFVKGTAATLIKDGQSTAQVELRGEKGWVRVDWPACTATVEGEAPHASRWAAGVASIVDIEVRDRARILADLLKSAPTRDDLAQELADVELGDDKVVEVVWKLIDEQGWDPAHAVRRDLGIELKGQWRQETRANWGARLAQSWHPDGWDEDLDVATEDSLAAAVAHAKHAHGAAIATAAVSGAERERIERLADQADELKEAFAQAEIEEARLEEVQAKAQAARAGLPPAGNEAIYTCVHCGGLLQFRQVDLATRVLEGAEQLSTAEQKKRRQAIAGADGALDKVNADVATHARLVERARDAMQIAVEAKAKLPEMPAASDNTADVEAAHRAVGEAEDRLARFHQMIRARSIRDRVNANELILKILAPDGLRARKLARVLELFNTRLGGLCKAADWRAVEIHPDMMVTYGGRPYGPQISPSAQFRVRAIVQLGLAQLDGSAMVIIDAADVLDAPSRRQLFALLDSTDFYALVCMTLSQRTQLPDLAAIELGASYWIDNGICEPLQQPAEAAE